jgi:hypothetical protein
MTEQKPPPQQVLMNLIFGRTITQMVGAVAELSIADHLKDGPRSADELARATGTHAPSLYRVMRAMAMVGLFEEHDDHRFSLTPVGTQLRSDLPSSMRGMAIFQSTSWHGAAWFELVHSIRTGQPGFPKAHGKTVFEWFHENADGARIFNDAMTAFSSSVAEAVVSAYDFSRFKRIADIGGGHGALLCAVLGQATGSTGIVFDLPPVVKGAQATIDKAGLASRCEIVGGDFFAAVPSGMDAYVMKSIIHDWSDEKARTILHNCAAGLNANGRVLVIEVPIPPPGTPSFGKLLDLEMLVMTDGGRERTESEYRALFADSGLKLEKIVPTQGPLAVIEASKA